MDKRLDVMRTVWRIGMLAGVLLAWTAAVAGAEAGDPFYKGLEQRGLRSLMEEYLRLQGAAVTEPNGQTPAGGPNAVALARLSLQKAITAQNLAERDNSFKQARTFFETGIAQAREKLKAVPADKINDGMAARREVINVRMALADMIFQYWLKTDLDFLEVTDRRAGDRDRATDLLRTSNEQYSAAIQDINVWLSALDQLPPDERRKLINTGKTRRIKDLQRSAEYSNAWITYFYGWILPKDYKAPKGKRTREELLNDAITAFSTYIDMQDRVSAKWYARTVIGMAHRELGQYDKALQSLALVNPPPTDADASDAVKKRDAWKDPLRIRVVYERALTYIRKGDYEEARKTVDEATEKWGSALESQLYGLALPLLKGESFIREGDAKGEEGTKQQGITILKEVHKRPNPWPHLVQQVMEDLIGKTPDEDLEPFQVWLRANDALAESQKTKDADTLKRAESLFNTYAEKVGPKDPKYAAALYSRAACLLQLGRKAEAAVLFRKVADEAPKYQYAAAAARYAVSVHGEVYEKNQTEANRVAYEATLRWFIATWLQTDPDQQYYYALILYRGKRYIDAADAFARVPENAELYPDSKFWVALCRLEHFRERVLSSRDKQLILTGARNVAQSLLTFAEYATSVKGKVPEKKQEQLMAWAESAYINAADVYLYPEVSLPADAVPVLDAVEKSFQLSDEALGNVLKLRITAYQKLGKLDEASKVLEKFLTIADPAKVGPVLRGLFAAMISEVRDLIKRGNKDVAANRVEQAKGLGDRLSEWLETSTLADKAQQIENGRYDLAELYLAVGNYSGALLIYQEIGGPKPWEKKKDDPLKLDCVYGMARAFEGLGDKERGSGEVGTGQAKQHYETSLDIWRVLVNVADASPDEWWDRTYHQYYCKFRLGGKEEVREALGSLRIMRGGLGGKDPLLQKQFRDLEAAVAG